MLFVVSGVIDVVAGFVLGDRGCHGKRIAVGVVVSCEPYSMVALGVYSVIGNVEHSSIECW